MLVNIERRVLFRFVYALGTVVRHRFALDSCRCRAGRALSRAKVSKDFYRREQKETKDTIVSVRNACSVFFTAAWFSQCRFSCAASDTQNRFRVNFFPIFNQQLVLTNHVAFWARSLFATTGLFKAANKMNVLLRIISLIWAA